MDKMQQVIREDRQPAPSPVEPPDQRIAGYLPRSQLLAGAIQEHHDLLDPASLPEPPVDEQSRDAYRVNHIALLMGLFGASSGAGHPQPQVESALERLY